MFTITEKFEDYNGVMREETFYFNLTKAEALAFEHSHNGGVTTMIKRIVAAHDQPELIRLMQEFLHMTYGVKSDDGRKFVKNEEVWNEFCQTEAYSNIFMRLATDDKFAQEFLLGIVPRDAREEMIKQQKEHPELFALPGGGNA